MFFHKQLKFWPLQILAAILYLDILTTPKSIIEDGQPQLGIINFLFQVAIMLALSTVINHFMAKKPPPAHHAKPSGLEQFSLPTAEEGRPVQVLFGKRYIAGPNVVWYGDLRTQAIWSDGREGNVS